MIKSKKQMYVIIGAFILTLLLGTTTYAFFNYTRTGTDNNIRTGRVSFNTSQDGSINLTNAFPISSTQAQTDTTNAKSVSITVTGDTDYANGLEYLVTASDVNLTIGTGANAKTLPIALEVSVSSNTHGEAPNQITTTLGTAETGDYYTNRSSYTESKYKVLYDGELEEDARLLVGYIAPNATAGTPSGIDGTINIKAYIDSSKILISDTYPSGDVDTNNDNETDYTNETPSSMAEGKVVFTTTEWNNIQGSPLSFKVKVESNDGIWVTQPTAAQVISKLSNLETTPYGKIYTGANPNNYVIFNNEQWRILGVYGDKLKIVRVSPIADQIYNSSDSSNAWGGSTLQTTLNITYYNGLPDNVQNMIYETGVWNTGVAAWDDNAINAYSTAVNASWSGKVGLIATYEYLFAAGYDCRETSGANGVFTVSCSQNDWLKPNTDLWTITPQTNNSMVQVSYSNGSIGGYYIPLTKSVSPVVYLKSEVTITGGTGEPNGNEYTLSYTEN